MLIFFLKNQIQLILQDIGYFIQINQRTQFHLLQTKHIYERMVDIKNGYLSVPKTMLYFVAYVSLMDVILEYEYKVLVIVNMCTYAFRTMRILQLIDIMWMIM